MYAFCSKKQGKSKFLGVSFGKWYAFAQHHWGIVPTFAPTKQPPFVWADKLFSL